MVTLTELRYIIALQETGHFGKAADNCFVSQPTLSVAVKKLEEELGVCLFERSRGQVTCTLIGEKIVNQARYVLEQSERIRELAQLGIDPLGSPLALGAIHTVGPYLFPRVIPEVRALAPQMPLYIEENMTANLRERLRSGKLDAIIIALPFNEPEVVTQTLYEEPFVVLLPAEHPLSQLSTIAAEQLFQENVLLLGEGHCFRDQVLAACPGLQQHLARSDRLTQSVVEGSSLETLKHMVASGMGISVLPQSAAEVAPYGKGVLCTRPLSGPSAMRSVALAWRASFPRHQALDVIGTAVRRATTPTSTLAAE